MSSIKVSNRIRYLDGLRGVASLVVVAFHCIGAFYPKAFSSSGGLSWYLDGQLMVAVFFVISGYVLSGVYENTKRGFISSAYSRFIRLYSPVLFAYCFALVLNSAFSPYTKEVASKISGVMTLWSNHGGLRFILDDLFGALSGYANSGILPVRSNVELDRSNLVPLWTISYELIGSLLVYIVSRLRVWSYYAWLSIVVLIFFVFGFREISLFALGNFLYHSENSLRRYSIWIASICAIIFFFLNYIGWYFEADRIDAYFSGIVSHHSPLNVLKSVGGATLFILSMNIHLVRSILESRIPRFLGDISFPLYLLHWPIVVCIGSFIYLHITENWVYIFSICLAITIPLSVLFSRAIDRPSINYAKNIK